MQVPAPRHKTDRNTLELIQKRDWEGTGAYVTYVIRRSKGDNKGHNLEIQEIQPKHKTKERVIQH